MNNPRIDGDENRAVREVQRLEQDARLVIRMLEENLRERPLDSPSGDHGNYFVVTGDLWRKVVQYCLAVALLLRSGAFGPAVVVTRTAYEIAINLIYLVTKGNKVKNAVLFRTRTLLEVEELNDGLPAGIEAHRILDTVPPEIVGAARTAKRKRLPWVGVSLAEMAQALDVKHHKPLYGLFSWETHGRIAGYDVEDLPQEGDLRKLRFEDKTSPKERWGIANNTRRTLHGAYKVVALDWLGAIPPLPTTDPFTDGESERTVKDGCGP